MDKEPKLSDIIITLLIIGTIFTILAYRELHITNELLKTIK